MKKSKAEELIKSEQKKFRCPVCNGSMVLHKNISLACVNNHSFDLSKTGYLNLLTSHSNFVYSKELFAARHVVCAKGFFDPLIDEIGNTLENYCSSSDLDTLAVLDAGCGEGHHLSSLSRRMGDLKSSLFGVDIAKEGIRIASKNAAEIVWIVSDLAKLPFQRESFHVILNILSPANYHEFERVLAADGIVVKVIPGKHYLEELRKLIFKDNNYSSDRVEDYFSNKLEVVSKENIRYQFEVTEEVLPFLLKMTPLTWGGNIVELEDCSKRELSSVTVDLTILIGRKNCTTRSGR